MQTGSDEWGCYEEWVLCRRCGTHVGDPPGTTCTHCHVEAKIIFLAAFIRWFGYMADNDPIVFEAPLYSPYPSYNLKVTL